MEYSCVEVFAQDGEDFQEYVYEDGTYVEEGESIGVEIVHGDGEGCLYLFDGIYFASEPKKL